MDTACALFSENPPRAFAAMTNYLPPFSQPIISISIPTYNRSKRLKETLARLGKHPEILENWVEIIVADNASTDDTPDIVTDFVAITGKSVRYKRNASNLGIDGNIHVVSHLATGRYLLLMSDDDILLPGTLTFLRQMIESIPDLLFCFLNGGSFSGGYDPLEPINPIVSIEKTLITRDPNKIVEAIGVHATFISAFFVERSSWVGVPDQSKYIGTDIYLTHILYRVLAANRGRTSVVAKENLIAARREYTGSFRIFHAFGNSFMHLLCIDGPNIGFRVKSMKYVKKSTIRRGLPPMILMVRFGAAPRELTWQEWRVLFRYTWWEPLAWICLLPPCAVPRLIFNILKWIKHKFVTTNSLLT